MPEVGQDKVRNIQFERKQKRDDATISIKNRVSEKGHYSGKW